MQPRQLGIECLQQVIVYEGFYGFVWDTALCNSPYASRRLAKAYVVQAGLYGCQVWSSGFFREGDVFRPTLQTLHFNC